MAPKPLKYVSTDWTQLEQILDIAGPESLVKYLADRYVKILLQEFRKYNSKLDEGEIYMMVSQIFYDLLKDDYHQLKKINRNQGRLRGLLFHHIRCKVYSLKRKKHQEVAFIQSVSKSLKENPPIIMLEIIHDVHQVLQTLKNTYPNLHVVIYGHYFEEKSVKTLAEELNINVNAVKQRLFIGRQWLERVLRDYNT